MVSDWHKWLAVAVILAIGWMPDIIDIPDDPYWYLYVWGAVVDSIVLVLVFVIRLRSISLLIILLQVWAMFCHLGGITTQFAYNILYEYYSIAYEPLALANDQYSIWLRTIIVLKILVMLVGANGIRQRNHRDRMAANSGINHPGFVVVRNTTPDQECEG